MREITKYNEDVRDEIQREHIRHGDWEYADNDIHFVPDNIAEMDIPLLEHGEPTVLVDKQNDKEEEEEEEEEEVEQFIVCLNIQLFILILINE